MLNWFVATKTDRGIFMNLFQTDSERVFVLATILNQLSRFRGFHQLTRAGGSLCSVHIDTLLYIYMCICTTLYCEPHGSPWYTLSIFGKVSSSSLFCIHRSQAYICLPCGNTVVHIEALADSDYRCSPKTIDNAYIGI